MGLLSFRMNRRLISNVFVLLFAAPLFSAAARSGPGNDPPPPLNLLPEPKEVIVRLGEFRLKPKTRILVQLGHQEEDRIAAETLAEEVSDHSGLRLSIIGTKVSSKAAENAIMLVRLQDIRVKRFLASRGLRGDSAIGREGYLLFSDESHLIVAANTGQGLFAGVQTLRQLLREDGKFLICPAVTIRDWPNLEGAAAENDNEERDTVVKILGPGL
jgi:hexosaminidase